MPKNRATAQIYLVLEKDEKYLLARRYNTGYQDGNYNLPSGHIEEGELPTEALKREAKEEVGIDLSLEDARLVHVLCRAKHDETGDHIDFFFLVHEWEGEIQNTEPHKCDDLSWFAFNEFPLNMTPHVRHAFEQIQLQRTFSELPVAFFQQHGLYTL